MKPHVTVPGSSKKIKKGHSMCMYVCGMYQVSHINTQIQTHRLRGTQIQTHPVPVKAVRRQQPCLQVGAQVSWQEGKDEQERPEKTASPGYHVKPVSGETGQVGGQEK